MVTQHAHLHRAHLFSSNWQWLLKNFIIHCCLCLAWFFQLFVLDLVMLMDIITCTIFVLVQLLVYLLVTILSIAWFELLNDRNHRQLKSMRWIQMKRFYMHRVETLLFRQNKKTSFVQIFKVEIRLSVEVYGLPWVC